ncbi:MAG: hypothetical protein IJ298_05120 [Ruminococcus sp.]|nr:hypothetical protein [Ruminococcus sp.]
MKKSINFASLSKLMLIIAAAVVVAGIALLAILGGNTFAYCSFANLSFSLVAKVAVAAVLVCALVLVYFVIRFKKSGVMMAVVSTIGAAVNALVAFALCIICRANLSDMAFAVVLFAVALSYITFVLFAHSFTKKTSRKKAAEPEVDAFSVAADKVWQLMVIMLILICVVIVAAFVASLVFSAWVLALYALPAILTAVFSVLFTLSFTCKLYADKA